MPNAMGADAQSFAIAAGLVVAALLGLVVAWKLTKSLVSLLFWIAAAVVIALAAWWLLARLGILPPFPGL
ncbi:MAG: hypothetical protein KIT22_03510 [Verrucomicrobiae bacterium]|nr:hypothetical protein [Verrucomicrobiae bacterium]